MSFDVYVLVPAGSWPTARQIDDALIANDCPVRMGPRPASAWDAPLAPVPAEPIRYIVENPAQAAALGRSLGEQVEIPHHIVMPVVLDGAVLDPDFGMEAVTDSYALNSQLSSLQDGPVAALGDLLVWFSHHSDQRNYNAAMYILAVHIMKFDGHGFEMQGMSHGRALFARELLDSLYTDPAENPFS